MRDYAKVSPRFWTGSTGKTLRKAGPETQVLALYLITCPHSNMIGLYYLPWPLLIHETGLSPEGASKALRRASEGAFCYYEKGLEIVFIPEMAKFQIGDELKPNDKRVKGIKAELLKYCKCQFYNDFLDKYRISFCLEELSPFEGASKALRSQEQEQEQEQENIFSEKLRFSRHTSEEVRLAEILLSEILARKPDFKPPDIQAWARSIDRMIRLDHRTPADIERIIRWCQGDDFWADNILSTAKLRKQYDRLDLQSRRNGNSNRRTNHAATRPSFADQPLTDDEREIQV